MRISGTVNWKTLLFLINLVNVSRQSIAGITYQDDYDFAEKYRNVHECNPFYWHPLHLPEQCAEMFADLIRSRVAMAAKKPVRVVTRRENPIFGKPRAVRLKEDIYSLRHFYNYVEPEYEQPIYETEYIYGNDNDFSIEKYEGIHKKRDQAETEENYEEEYEYLIPPYLSQYDKMLALLRHDIDKNPIAPVVAMSNYGPVAMYQQPISKQSKNIINKIAHAYARTKKLDKKDNDGYYYGKIEFPLNNMTNNYINMNKNTKVKGKRGKIKKIKLRKKAKREKHSKSLIIE